MCVAASGVVKKLAPDADQLVQWLNYLKEDGITLHDKLEVVTLAEPTLVGVNCLDFDGAQNLFIPDDAWDWASGTIEFDVKCTTPVSVNGYLVRMYGAADSRIYVYLGDASGLLVTRIGDNTMLNGNIPLDESVSISVSWDGSTSRTFVNGTMTAELAYSTSSAVGTLRFGDAVGFIGKLYNAKFSKQARLTPDQVLEYTAVYTLGGSEGLPYDSSGNANHSPAMTATRSTDDGVYSSNHSEGFSNVTLGRLSTHETGTPSGAYVRIGSTDYANLDTALASAEYGDTVLLGSGDYTRAYPDVPVGVNIAGTLAADYGSSGTMMSQYMRLNGDSTISGVSFSNGGNYSMTFVGDNNAMDNCYQDGLGTSGHGILVKGSNTKITNCTFMNNGYHGVAVKGYGHEVSNCTVEGGPFNAIIVKADDYGSFNNTTFDILIDSNSLVGKDGVSGTAIYLEAYSDESRLYDVVVQKNSIVGIASTGEFAYGLLMKSETNASVDAVAYSNSLRNSTRLITVYGVDPTSVVNANLNTLYTESAGTYNDDGLGTYDIKYSSRAYTSDSITLLPALYGSKTLAYDGGNLTNSGCSSTGVHNGSEVGVDYSATGIASLASPLYWQDFVDWPNGTDNFYLKFIQDPSCKVKESGLYGAAYDPDYDTQIALHKYWTVGDCGTAGVAVPTYLTITIDGTKHLATRDDDATSGYPTWIGTNLTVDWFDSAVDYWRIVYAGSLSDYDTSSTIPPEGSWDNMSPSTATVFVEWGNTMTPITHEGDIVTHEGDYLYN